MLKQVFLNVVETCGAIIGQFVRLSAKEIGMAIFTGDNVGFVNFVSDVTPMVDFASS